MNHRPEKDLKPSNSSRWPETYGAFLHYNFLRLFICLFLERGEERERNINVWLPFECPLLGTWPTTQACALTGNQIGDPLICSSALSLLSHTSQGSVAGSAGHSFFSLHPRTVESACLLSPDSTGCVSQRCKRPWGRWSLSPRLGEGCRGSRGNSASCWIPFPMWCLELDCGFSLTISHWD